MWQSQGPGHSEYETVSIVHIVKSLKKCVICHHWVCIAKRKPIYFIVSRKKKKIALEW